MASVIELWVIFGRKQRLATRRRIVDYVLSLRAAQDIQEIADYGFTNFGIAKSREYGQGLKKCIKYLAESPSIGLAADELADSLRRYKYESHWIFYLEQNREILVVQILQKNMDFVRHLRNCTPAP